MEMLVIAVVAIVAFGIVLVPLFRRGTASAREFAPPTRPAAPDAFTRAAEADAGVEAGAPISAGAGSDAAPDELEREVQRYRSAVRAGTVCSKCGQANPAGSVFCYECGRRLPLADAKEFE